MGKIINQQFGKNWAMYHADCVFGMRNLPQDSVDLIAYSPPFLALYIYSDSIADLGNTDSEAQFFEGWIFHLQEQFRILKPGKYVAIHCKDTMRYMSSHGYAGLYDFPGHIVRLAREVGFLFERWVTVWKDPVIEMQRTKTYGLLHKSFQERGEVTRQGCADYVLIFRKPLDEDDKETKEELPPINARVIERAVQQWTNEGEDISTPLCRDIRDRIDNPFLSKPIQFSFWTGKEYDTPFIKQLLDTTTPGRNTTIHCTAQMMTTLIQDFEKVEGWKFHSRVTLSDGSFLITFRNWSSEFENNVVKHCLQPPDVDYQKFEIVSHYTKQVDGDVEVIVEEKETWRQAITRGDEVHPDYVGTQPPIGWRDQNYYSILTWQRYASPVWFDLEGLPPTHPNCWMDIQQTNVLNAKGVKNDDTATKHICPLQLDLIERLILEYTKEGEIVTTPYGGIGSEGYEAIKLGRKAILFELKEEYFKTGCKNLTEIELSITQESMI